MNFEIKYKDARARIGTFSTKHGKITTPTLMPVIHPKKQTIKVKDYGAKMVITNSYIINKDEELKQKALTEGVHELIDFPGVIATDSGSFQLSVYGDIDITNKEVIQFQEAIGTDIGTSLDIPTPPYVRREQAENELNTTIARAHEAIETREHMLLNSVVQGSTFTDLRTMCAEDIGSMNFDIFPIGAVVPLMEQYKYADLVDVVMSSMKGLPESKPRHLMGAGHPMVFALAVAMGCDLFDSAAYILYANNNRLMMPTGTLRLENLIEMPCSCEVCTKYTPEDLLEMEHDQRAKLLAIHNLHISFAEIRQIKQAIKDGTLMNLVEERCASHPFLLDGLRRLKEYNEDMELLNPSSKESAFFYTGPESLNRPEIYHHQKRLNNLNFEDNDKLIILPHSRKPYGKHIIRESLHNKKDEKLNKTVFFSKDYNPGSDWSNADIIIADVPFGIIPLELDEFYPLAQNESPSIHDMNAIKFVQDSLKKFSKNYEEILIHKGIIDRFYKEDETDFLGVSSDIILPTGKIDDFKRLNMVADYQFGTGSGKAIFGDDPEKLEIEKSKKTKKIRSIKEDDEIVVNMRANDGFLILSDIGAKRLHKHSPSPKNRVIINGEVAEFARKGKSVFSKFVLDADSDIRKNDEILIVDQDDTLLSYGKSLLSSKEMLEFNIGSAVKTRKPKNEL